MKKLSQYPTLKEIFISVILVFVAKIGIQVLSFLSSAVLLRMVPLTNYYLPILLKTKSLFFEALFILTVVYISARASTRIQKSGIIYASAIGVIYVVIFTITSLVYWQVLKFPVPSLFPGIIFTTIKYTFVSFVGALIGWFTSRKNSKLNPLAKTHNS